MLTELVISLLIILEATSSQYAPVYANQYYQTMPQYYQDQPAPQVVDYEDKRSSDNKYGSGGSNEDESGSDECQCTCAACKDRFHPVKSCCREFCNSCPAEAIYSPGPIYNMPMSGTNSGSLYNMPVSGQNPGNVVFVPYPYPMMLPNSVKNATTPTTMSTTTKETTEVTTTATPPRIINLIGQKSPEVIHRLHTKELIKNSVELETNDHMRPPQSLRAARKYMMTNMRKVKPAWEPKYGIVPIPDTLAEKLMSQLREVRELQPRRV